MRGLAKFTNLLNYPAVESLGSPHSSSGSTLARLVQYPCPGGPRLLETAVIDIVDRINEIADRIASEGMGERASLVRAGAVEISRQKYEIERLRAELVQAATQPRPIENELRTEIKWLYEQLAAQKRTAAFKTTF